jgi:hypothetical protein
MNPIEIKDIVRDDAQQNELDVQTGYAPEAGPHCAAANPHCPRRRRLKWALGLAVLGVIAVPGSFFVRANVFPPVFPVPSIEQTSEYQDATLLARAWQLPVAQQFQPAFQYQNNRTSCGPSSLANVSRSFGEVVDEAGVVRGSGKCWTGICFGGVTLDELSDLARLHPARKVTLLRDLGYDEFKQHLRQTNDPERRYIVNFQRGLLFGKGMGHHSPIGGYFERENLVFVLDVSERTKPFLVDAHRLFVAMNSVDPTSGKTRGLLLVEPRLPSTDLPHVVTEEK